MNTGAPETGSPAPVVVVSSWTGKNQAGMTGVAARVLMPLKDRTIIIATRHSTISPIVDGNFYIHIYASLPNTKPDGVKLPSQIWGIPVVSNHNAFRPSDTGIVIMDDNRQYAVAELVHDNLYIHHDIARNGSVDEERLFQVLLNRVLYLLNIPQDELRANARRLFVEECSKATVRSLMKVAVQPACEHTARIKQIKKSLSDKTREGTRSERQLIGNESTGRQALGAEYDALLSIPKIKEVQVENGIINVYTNTLFCRDDRTGILHEIGAFRIALAPGQSSPSWFNLTRLVDGHHKGMHAPHVFPAGNGCLGNTKDLFPQLMLQRQFAIAAQLAIEFVESVNTSDSAGAHINKWPVASVQSRR